MLADQPLLRQVALPTEHGGWSFTLEPVVLGLLVAPSGAGVALGAAALVVFVARTPLRIVLVDHRRGRRLPRTRLAERVVAAEVAVVVALAVAATVTADGPWWAPLAIASPLVAIELWFDMRSRSRRLLPELAGTVGIGSVVAAIVLAEGESWALALGLWSVMAARSIAAVGFVRLQLRKGKGQHHDVRSSDLAQVAALAVVGAGALVFDVSVAGVIAVAVLVLFHLVASRRPAPKAAVVGAQQVGLGLGVVVTAALGALVP